MLKVDSLTVPSMTLNTASSFIVPTESTSDNSFKIASIGYFNNFLATIAKLNVNNSLTSFTTTTSIIASPITTTTFNLCMNGSNIVCGSLINSLYICGTVQSWNTTWTKMLNGSGNNRIIRGTATLSGGTVTVPFGYTFSAIPYVIVSTQGTVATAGITQIQATATTSTCVYTSTNLTTSISFIIFGT